MPAGAGGSRVKEDEAGYSKKLRCLRRINNRLKYLQL